MSTANTAGANQPAPAPAPPSLPPNVSIFSPKNPATTQALFASAAIFTRLAVSASTAPAKLTEALESLSPSLDNHSSSSSKSSKSNAKQEFHLCHGNAVLVFDAAATSGGNGNSEDDNDEDDEEEQEALEEAVKDSHHEHVRAVCLAFKDRDIGLDIAGCVFDAPEAPRAGFQFDRLSDGAVMVVDLMHDDGGSDEEEEEDDDDDDDDEEANLKKLLAGAEVIS